MTKEKEAILEELGGIDETVYDGLVSDFIAQTKFQLDQAKTSALCGKHKAGAEVLHSIKGCAANLRLTAIYTAACAVEACFKSGAKEQEILEKLAILESRVLEV